MFDVTLNEENMVIQDGTSEGTQVKYKKDGFWYKLDNDGNEGLCEYLASELLRFTDLDKNEYIVYEQGLINGKPGCRSKDFFANDSEEFITFYRLYYNQYGRNLADVLAKYDTMEERIEYTTQFILKTCDIDITDYLRKIFTLDRIILNEDRHVNNLAIISTDSGFRPAPIFDNGRSLLTANKSVREQLGIEENVKRVIAKPFSGSHQKLFEYFGEGFKLNTKKALEWLNTEPPSRERDVLIYQIERCC